MRLLLAAASLAAIAAAANAQSPAQDRERLVSIYEVTVAQELCKFDLSDDDADAVGKASDRLEEQLGLSDEEAQKIYDQVEASLTKQKAAGLCDANGAGLKHYKETLSALTK